MHDGIAGGECFRKPFPRVVLVHLYAGNRRDVIVHDEGCEALGVAMQERAPGAFLEFTGGERIEVVRECGLDGVVLRQRRLDEHQSAAGAAPCPACDLGEQLEGPFAGAEVRHPEADIGRDDADERDPREVVSLGDHLRADEDVELAGGEPREQRRDRAAPADRVAVDPRDPRLGIALPDLGLDALGPEPGLLEIRAAAAHAFRRDDDRVIAVVAAGPADRLVDRERHAAVGALERVAALPAEHDRREAPAVEQHDRLLPCRQPFAERGHERFAEHDLRAMHLAYQDVSRLKKERLEASAQAGAVLKVAPDTAAKELAKNVTGKNI